MGMMIIRHKIRDYGHWRPIFDAHAEKTKDTKNAKAFAASADLKEAMTKAGVVDTPTIYFLESID
jgi:hypothetical protein